MQSFAFTIHQGQGRAAHSCSGNHPCCSRCQTSWPRVSLQLSQCCASTIYQLHLSGFDYFNMEVPAGVLPQASLKAASPLSPHWLLHSWNFLDLRVATFGHSLQPRHPGYNTTGHPQITESSGRSSLLKSILRCIKPLAVAQGIASELHQTSQPRRGPWLCHGRCGVSGSLQTTRKPLLLLMEGSSSSTTSQRLRESG